MKNPVDAERVEATPRLNLDHLSSQTLPLPLGPDEYLYSISFIELAFTFLIIR